jgi:5-carboxymethyl-2-hydroxymuconate isomerase
MPHLVLEYSANVLDTVDTRALFSELHTALLEFEAFPLADMKSRVAKYNEYFLGDGDARNAFVHLHVNLLSGRDISVRQRITQACIKILTQRFARSVEHLHCQVSVELREMERSTYAKYKPTPTTPPSS